MSDETMDMFFGLMTEVELKGGEPLIPYGRFDDNVYILKRGIMRTVYFDGLKEITYSFALPGTMMISYHSYYMRTPSFFQLEACCDSVLMKITKREFVQLMQQSNDFAQWIIWLSAAQLWIYEKKLSVVNGDAKERFESLVKNRPEIIEKVSAKIIASYIGITPQYFSKLKRRYAPEMKKKQE
jgi:CRP-like cAMP-binding protein